LPHSTGVSCGFFLCIKIPPQAKWLAGGRITPIKRELGYEGGLRLLLVHVVGLHLLHLDAAEQRIYDTVAVKSDVSKSKK